MKRPITISDILNSVEFELLQHALMEDEVSEGIQRLRTYQARTRAELFGEGPSPTFDDIVKVQFNANEMMATLIQAMNHRLEALRQEVRQAAYLKQHMPPIPHSLPDQELFSDHHLNSINTSFSTFDPMPPEPIDIGDRMKALDALAESIQDASHAMEMEVRQSNVPIIGGLLNRLRRALHELVLFYANKIVRRQSEVHAAYYAVLQELISLNRAQAQEIAQLRLHLQSLSSAEKRANRAPNQ
ncbi:hypothetical protein FKZ61_006185 [Litorilinea aerophila]|uniref:Uncharacterized protein n=1 Tax=Litorilinea aerophila TaxID=1204385 RepID=A0A540VJ89_9CHLR|nr:hypothetical protein [Litorilinea aerophila]MCC9075702.1 hypothetical protein [Litorilinea aerophila]OUC05692.1 hypothetical protein RY27_25735 [Litorilinea aerophila]